MIEGLVSILIFTKKKNGAVLSLKEQIIIM